MPSTFTNFASIASRLLGLARGAQAEKLSRVDAAIADYRARNRFWFQIARLTWTA